MSENKKLVPKRRFKEFENTDAWEQHKLGEDLVQVQTGTNKLGTTEDKGMPLIKMGNIQRGYFNLDKLEKLQIEDMIEPENILSFGDFLFNTRNTLALVGKGATWFGTSNTHGFNSNIARFTFKGINTTFFNYLYNTRSVLEQVLARAVGTTSVAAIYPRDIKSINYYIPHADEQHKIGTLFKTLDDTIAFQQRKLEKMKSMKSAYLSEMFPAEGERKPKRRFPGFTDDWEQRELGKVMNVTSVKRIHQSDWTDNGIRFLRARDIVSLFKNEAPSDVLYISKDRYEEYTKISGKVSQGDLLVTGVGSIGIPLLISSDNPLYFKDGNIIWFKNENRIDGNFFYYSFTGNRIQKFIKDVAGTGTVGTYTIDSGKRTPIYLPTEDEQKQIGSFFQNLDQTIAFQEQKLEKLQNIKKAYLNEMFI